MTEPSTALLARPTMPVAPPDSIDLSVNGRALRLAWQDRRIDVPGRMLRLACRCAHCLRARYDGRFIDDVGDIAIVVVSRMGNMGLNIGFSDGHARGIYPWPYLQEIAERAASLSAAETAFAEAAPPQ
jgi:DUF971 family protein